jgi:hypothetical protein
MNKLLTESSLKALSISWALLLLLTLVAVVLSQLSIASNSLILLALGITIVKSKLVVDIFMGLKTVDIRWRAIMLSYIVTIPVIIMIIYLSA